MPFYKNHVYPRLVSVLGNPKPIEDIRRRIVPLAQGSVLEIGVGPGVNFTHYVASDPIEVTPLQLITRTANIQGWASGTPAGEEDTLNFAELSGVRPMVERYPLEKAGEAYARMLTYAQILS